MTLPRKPDRTKPPARRGDWWLLYAPALLVTALAIWWRCQPLHRGYALSAFALVALVFLTRWDVSSRREKEVWGAIGLALFVLEMVLALQAHARVENFALGRFTAPGEAVILVQGGSVMRGVFLEIVNEDDLEALKAAHIDDGGRWWDIHQHIPLGVLTPGVPLKIAAQHHLKQGGIARYRLEFRTADTSWWEDVQAVDRSGRSVQALRVMRFLHGKPAQMYEEADGAYPRTPAGAIDWGWASAEP